MEELTPRVSVDNLAGSGDSRRSATPTRSRSNTPTRSRPPVPSKVRSPRETDPFVCVCQGSLDDYKYMFPGAGLEGSIVALCPCYRESIMVLYVVLYVALTGICHHQFVYWGTVN